MRRHKSKATIPSAKRPPHSTRNPKKPVPDKADPVITESMVSACTAFLLASGRLPYTASTTDDAAFSRALLTEVMACRGTPAAKVGRKVRKDVNGPASHLPPRHMDSLWVIPDVVLFDDKIT